jgi:hypothetical protein
MKKKIEELEMVFNLFADLVQNSFQFEFPFKQERLLVEKLIREIKDEEKIL